MGLEEERLAWRQDAELTAAAGLPEIHLTHFWPGGQEAIPAVIEILQRVIDGLNRL
jgi:hypothetical protein